MSRGFCPGYFCRGAFDLEPFDTNWTMGKCSKLKIGIQGRGSGILEQMQM